jgi:hypothetical protein
VVVFCFTCRFLYVHLFFILCLKLLADNIRDFLALFGIGYSELGFADLSNPPDEPQSAARLRDWLVSEFGIRCPTTGIELASRAQSRHPDFAEWIHAVIELRDKKAEPDAVANGGA